MKFFSKISRKKIFFLWFFVFLFMRDDRKIAARGFQKNRYTFESGSSWTSVQYEACFIPLAKTHIFQQFFKWNLICWKNSEKIQAIFWKFARPFLVTSRVYKKWCIFFVVMWSSSIVPHLTYILLIVSITGRFKKRQNDRFSKRKQPRPDRPSIVPEIQGRWRDDHLAL